MLIADPGRQPGRGVPRARGAPGAGTCAPRPAARSPRVRDPPAKTHLRQLRPAPRTARARPPRRAAGSRAGSSRWARGRRRRAARSRSRSTVMPRSASTASSGSVPPSRTSAGGVPQARSIAPDASRSAGSAGRTAPARPPRRRARPRRPPAPPSRSSRSSSARDLRAVLAGRQPHAHVAARHGRDDRARLAHLDHVHVDRRRRAGALVELRAGPRRHLRPADLRDRARRRAAAAPRTRARRPRRAPRPRSARERPALGVRGDRPRASTISTCAAFRTAPP